ncbi:MAG: hybrid sensor histidine kinase/response regulator [Myxococcales bacterium]|nr:hybrid sensor histidine kinase/response regulator [Myxococcales bacterium]
MKVLHIEDRPENRLLVRKLLESRGVHVVDADDGLLGLELARTTAPDLILVDINIPGLDGYEVVSRLKGDPQIKPVPVVAITAEGDRDRALALGFDGFLAKPVRPATFFRAIEAFLAGKREAPDEARRVAHLADHAQKTVHRLEAKVRELTHANERLREVDRLKREVLRNVSHELSTPMTPLLGYARMLLGEELGPLTAGQRTVVERLDGNLRRLKGQIDNLLNVTRFATGAVSIEFGVVEPAELARQALQGVGGLARARGVTVERTVEASEPVVADRSRLVEAVIHLLQNAIKFGPEGGTVQLRLVAEGPSEARWLRVEVCDQGPGIAPGERQKVREPFYQVDGSATRAHGGAGLGLALADRAAEMHDGELIIGEAPGGGACLVLRLPTRPRRGGPGGAD